MRNPRDVFINLPPKDPELPPAPLPLTASSSVDSVVGAGLRGSGLSALAEGAATV